MGVGPAFAAIQRCGYAPPWLSQPRAGATQTRPDQTRPAHWELTNNGGKSAAHGTWKSSALVHEQVTMLPIGHAASVACPFLAGKQTSMQAECKENVATHVLPDPTSSFWECRHLSYLTHLHCSAQLLAALESAALVCCALACLTFSGRRFPEGCSPLFVVL
jgi:hypothetical protein